MSKMPCRLDAAEYEATDHGNKDRGIHAMINVLQRFEHT